MAGLPCMAVDRAAGQACIAVSDDGEGMDALELQSLLAPSGQSNSAPRLDVEDRSDAPRAARRMGLGFAVVRAGMQHHGGLIEGASAPGAGTVFWLRLPLHREQR